MYTLSLWISRVYPALLSITHILSRFGVVFFTETRRIKTKLRKPDNTSSHSVHIYIYLLYIFFKVKYKNHRIVDRRVEKSGGN